RVEVVAETGGGPNGAAIGPDGHVWITNNGGFEWNRSGGRLLPGGQALDYTSGSIHRVNIETGAVETVYTECDGVPLKGPNDIVFDSSGGFWFSDLGKNREYDRDLGALYYATTDGNHISRAVFPIPGGANGVGLAPNDTHVYIAETPTGRLFGWEIAEPSVLASDNAAAGFHSFIANAGGYTLFDSLAVEESGNVCVATIGPGGGTVITPDPGDGEHVGVGVDPLTTNICFGGADMQTAYITLSTSGRLISCQWPRPGLRLHFNA
ncbi:MAG: SMP-30/gluconolactonase/LRE family protein, partial [Chloroflexi bacterium]|nr:SMP-30/gluconolactonase/LRE family protein [Chloroflexota bacterium]